MKVILIAGKARAGKDTCATFIKTKLERKGKKVVIASYGDLVKFVCEKYFGWNGQKDEKGRTILQYVGTDIVREQRPNYWVDFVINFLSMFKNEWDYVIVADCRFPNELQRWGEEWDTTTLRVNRISFESNLTEEQKNHPSEIALDNYYFDYTIYSESGLTELEKEVDKFLEWMEEMDE